MNSREQILGRIQEAVRYSAKHPGLTHGPGAAVERGLGFRRWLPSVSEAQLERIALFEERSAALKTNFVRCTDLAVAGRLLANIAAAEEWKSVAYHPDVTLVDLVHGLGLTCHEINASTPISELETASAGITLCDALVAQTGGVLLTAKSAGGRALSVLPPHHLVVAHESQLLPDLPAAFDLLQQRYGEKLPSFCTFITGPSRTADIERTLVLGAHGPKRLTILFIATPNGARMTNDKSGERTALRE
jgi:L-lactate dehydrogenase complex protein LldG